MNHQGRPSRANPGPYGSAELLRTTEAVRCGQHRRRSGGELGAALAAASGQDRAAGAGAHTKTEAVGLRAAAVVRLEGALAHGALQERREVRPQQRQGSRSYTSVAPGLASCSPHNRGSRDAKTSARARQGRPERLSHATTRLRRGSNQPGPGPTPAWPRHRTATEDHNHPDSNRAESCSPLSTPGDDAPVAGRPLSTSPVGIFIFAGRRPDVPRAPTAAIPAFAQRPSNVHRGVNDSAPFPTGCGQLCGQRSSVAD